MKAKQHRNIYLVLISITILFVLGCNENKKEEKQEAATITNDSSHEEVKVSDNEVKSEAPDSKTKIEQGYASPHHANEQAQSPINIISSNVAKAGKDEVSFSFHSEINAAENLGHTVQVDFQPGSTCISNGRNYTSKQFHFHTPSEHLIDGVTYPMEMHIVNTIVDSANGNTQSYLVVGILFKMGKENSFIKEFLDKVPSEEGKKSDIQTGAVKLEDLFAGISKSELHSCFSYHGSLTTPPFTEAVQWVVLKHPVEASEQQIMAIEKMEGNNARHVQAVNGRKVVEQ
jgi:carbonic anhydrase